MRSSSVALSIATLIGLQACGGGGESAVSSQSPSPVVSPAPTPAPTPAPATEPAPAPASSPGEMAGAAIDMNQPFNQQIDCKYGVKPYFEPADSGPWTVSFDGAVLRLQSQNGSRIFGGEFDSGVAAIERENYSGAAMQRTVVYEPAIGHSGTIYFTKSLTGEILAAGHNAFTGYHVTNVPGVECGGNTATEWLARPEKSLFRGSQDEDRPGFSDGVMAMNCQRSRGNEAGAIELIGAQVRVSEQGSIHMLGNDGTTLFSVADFNGPDRTVEKRADSPLLANGGVRYYASTDSQNNSIGLNLRWDNLLTSLSSITEASGGLASVTVNCKPAPLEWR